MSLFIHNYVGNSDDFILDHLMLTIRSFSSIIYEHFKTLQHRYPLMGFFKKNGYMACTYIL